MHSDYRILLLLFIHISILLIKSFSEVSKFRNTISRINTRNKNNRNKATFCIQFCGSFLFQRIRLSVSYMLWLGSDFLHIKYTIPATIYTYIVLYYTIRTISYVHFIVYNNLFLTSFFYLKLETDFDFEPTTVRNIKLVSVSLLTLMFMFYSFLASK